MKKFIFPALFGLLVAGCFESRTEEEINKICDSNMREVSSHFGSPVEKKYVIHSNTTVVWFYQPVTNSPNYITVTFAVDSHDGSPSYCVTFQK